MTISQEHQGLLSLISEWCNSKGDSEQYLVMMDSYSDGYSQLPPIINGHRSDLVWMKSNGDFLFIGEAKTRNDLNNNHTRKQITSFIDALEEQGDGLLIVAVPWGLEGVAGSLIASLQRKQGYETRRWKVISNTPEIKRV